MRANLEQIILKHSPDIHDLEGLLDKIEALYSKEEDSSLEARRSSFIEELRPFIGEYDRAMVNDFAKHFLQIVKGGRKYLFEKQTTWNTKLRLANWKRNQVKWSIANMIKQKQ